MMSPLVILLPRRVYLEHFGSKIAKIVRCYCHDLGQSERNVFDFSLCVNGLSLDFFSLFYILIIIYFFKYETIVSKNGLSLGYSERDTSSVIWYLSDI